MVIRITHKKRVLNPNGKSKIRLDKLAAQKYKNKIGTSDKVKATFSFFEL